MLSEQVNHMDRMFKDMLRVMQLKKPATYTFVPHDINEIVRAVIDSPHLRVAGKNQTVTGEYNPALPPVWADNQSLRQALGKIAENAVLFTPSEGMITFRLSQQNGEVIVEITDTGPGIDPTDMPHIFEHFYRGDPARRTDTGGAGLGLTLAREIIDAHRGRIEVESVLGKGSTFRIYLPVRRGNVRQEGNPAKTPVR
jgi:signal transduction histidine kinase